MKKRVSVFLAVLLVVACGMAFAGEKYRDGSFIGFVPNERGDIIVDLKIKNDMIVAAEILNPVKVKTTYQWQAAVEAFEQFPSAMIANQGKMDVISGATGSVNQYNQAAQMALDIASGTYTDNVYYGVSRDYGRGHVILKVTVDKEANKILAVEVVGAQKNPKEDPTEARAENKAVSGYPWPQAVEAYKKIPAQIVAEQTLNVDVISGATGTYNAFIEAVEHALEQAGMNVKDFRK